MRRMTKPLASKAARSSASGPEEMSSPCRLDAQSVIVERRALAAQVGQPHRHAVRHPEARRRGVRGPGRGGGCRAIRPRAQSTNKRTGIARPADEVPVRGGMGIADQARHLHPFLG